MQYYGPFHAGVAWPMLPDVWLLPLGRTWKPQDPPSGDAIGECLENHTVEEAFLLSTQMAEGVQIRDKDGRDVLDVLAERWKDDHERMLDIGVMKALAYQFISGRDLFSFYLDRAKAIYESRVRRNNPAALAALKRMDAAVAAEEEITRKMIPLARADSRLGFHSEAEAHQYHPAKLEWRLNELKRTHVRISEIRHELEKGGSYPHSEHEKAAPACRLGDAWTAAKGGLKFRVNALDNGDLAVEIVMKRPRAFSLATLDAAGVTWYRQVAVSSSGEVTVPRHYNAVTPTHEIVRSACKKTVDGLHVSFTLSSSAWGGREDRRPEWLQLIEGFDPIWPDLPHPDRGDGRLNLSPMRAELFGRLCWQ